MSQYEFENHSDGDWEDNGEIAWNEADWQKFLRNADKEVSRFISAYNKVSEDNDRLDAAAAAMGWHREDWSSLDEDLDEDQIKQIRAIELEELSKMEPYTIHRHPIYISSIGLYAYLKYSWEHYMKNNPIQTEASLAWSYCSSLADGEKTFIIGRKLFGFGRLSTCSLSFQKSTCSPQ